MIIMKTFDTIIIGSGQAGTPLAFNLTASGIEMYDYGTMVKILI